jgi:hypothetical protein
MTRGADGFDACDVLLGEIDDVTVEQAASAWR